MKKLIFAIVALLSFLSNPLNAQKAEYVSGVQMGEWVENKLPFEKVIEKNLFKKDSLSPIYFTVLPTKKVTTVPAKTEALIFIFDDQSIKDTLRFAADSNKAVIFYGGIINPMTDWSTNLQDQWEKYLEEDGFNLLKKYPMVIVTGFEVVDKDKIPYDISELTLEEKQSRGIGPNGETNGSWVIEPFSGTKKWVTK